jgi:hypothetical protein
METGHSPAVTINPGCVWTLPDFLRTNDRYIYIYKRKISFLVRYICVESQVFQGTRNGASLSQPEQHKNVAHREADNAYEMALEVSP